MFTKSLDSLDLKFRNKFLDQHRRLKAAIHKCQHQAYSNEGLKYEESEGRARECFLPLLLIRRHAATVMANIREEADKCISEAAKQSESSVSSSGDPIKLKCLQKYKEDLKSNVPKT